MSQQSVTTQSPAASQEPGHAYASTAYIIPVALAAVALVLFAGLWNMLRGGSPNLSQTLMRWRVVLQFIALCLVMAAIYFSGRY